MTRFPAKKLARELKNKESSYKVFLVLKEGEWIVQNIYEKRQ